MNFEATIRTELAKLKPEVRKPWRTFDALPYLHATDDPKAKMYNTPVVGRFDYLPAMGYIEALHPVAVEALLAELDRSRIKPTPWKFVPEGELIVVTKPNGDQLVINKSHVRPETAELFNAMAEALSK